MNRIEKRIDLLYALRRNRLNHILEDYHLTYEDYQLITVVHYMDGSSIDELKKESKMNTYSMHMIMNDLLKKDLISIKDDKLYLSDKVKDAYPRIKKLIKKEDQKLADQMSHEEVSQIIDSLDKLIDYYEE